MEWGRKDSVSECIFQRLCLIEGPQRHLPSHAFLPLHMFASPAHNLEMAENLDVVKEWSQSFVESVPGLRGAMGWTES